MQAQDKCVAMAEQLLEKEAALQKMQADADNEKATGRRNKKSERLRELEAQVRAPLSSSPLPLPPWPPLSLSGADTMRRRRLCTRPALLPACRQPPRASSNSRASAPIHLVHLRTCASRHDARPGPAVNTRGCGVGAAVRGAGWVIAMVRGLQVMSQTTKMRETEMDKDQVEIKLNQKEEESRTKARKISDLIFKMSQVPS